MLQILILIIVLLLFFFFLKRCNNLITYILTQQIEGKKRGGMQD